MAGGLGTRIGAPKAGLPLRGRPLIEYPLAAFAAAGVEAVVIAKKRTPLPGLTVPVWLEPDEPVHPLVGIINGFERAESSVVVVCACDMPFVTGQLLARLFSLEHPLALPRAAGRLHPLLARYERALLPSLRTALQEQRAIHEAVASLDPYVLEEEELAPFGDPERLLFNINTPADLARAEELV